ncbi:stage V sporulation protein AD [Bacillus sp. TS-2]|nr:stage V sporulation protein AD [Bacillus sp. TS-2]
MLKGHQSWLFSNEPVILSTGVVAGPFEAKGRLAEDFDRLYDDLWLGEDSYEKAQKVMIEDSITIAIEKENLSKENINFMCAGDLVNQLTPSSFAGRTLGIPYVGLFGACSTSMEGLALSAYIVNYQGAQYMASVASSHNTATEKQFRYPTEYGGQKPPTAQWTATAAGAAIIGQSGAGPKITSATMGKIIDMGLSDPFNMGGAMAPAAVDTIISHFRDLQLPPDYYDLIITGDLGKIGLSIAREMLKEKGMDYDHNQLQDCGLLLYREDQPVLAGGSGPGCSASVLYGHLLKRMKQGEWNRILVVATGALLSPLSFQQKESIPTIAHAVSIERGAKT